MKQTNSGLGISVKITQEIPFGSQVKIVGPDREVAICEPGDYPVGYLQTNPIIFPGFGSVQTSFNLETDVLYSGAVSPGEYVKFGPLVDGVQTYQKWDSATDDPTLIAGYSPKGGADGVKSEILI